MLYEVITVNLYFVSFERIVALIRFVVIGNRKAHFAVGKVEVTYTMSIGNYYSLMANGNVFIVILNCVVNYFFLKT